ncbi:ribonuclease H-like domain-containing protein, partial [Tanacetum coccineum]
RALKYQFESLKFLQRQLFGSSEDWDVSSLQSKSTWDDLILYHEGPSDVKESRIMDMKLCYNIFKFKKVTKEVPKFLPKPQKHKSCRKIRACLSYLDFQDSPDDEDDTRSSHEYLNYLEEVYQARALLAKFKRFFKKGTQRFSSAQANGQTECHKCGKKGHFARDCWSKTLGPSYQSPFQTKSPSFPQHKPELRPTKDFEAKYNKVKAKLALLSSSASASKASMVKNKGLIAEAYEWDEEEVSSDDNEMVKVKVLMALAEENNVVFILPNHDTGRILPTESQRNTTDPLVSVTDSSVTDYDSANEFSVCSTPLPLLKKLDGAEPISGPKTIKSILRSKSTFKAKTLKCVIINEPSSALAKDNKSYSTSKVNSTPTGKLKSVKFKDDPPLAIVIKELNNLKLQFSKSQSSYSRSNQPLQCEKTDYRTRDHAEYISTKNMSQHLKSLDRSSSRSKIPRPYKNAILFNHLAHTKERSFQEILNMHSKDVKFVVAQLIPQLIIMILNGSKECDIKNPIWYLDSRCSRHMTGVKSYLHKYVEQPQYLTHTDYALWEVIMNGDAPAIASASTEGPIPPKTAEQKLARKNELKAKSTFVSETPSTNREIHGEVTPRKMANLKCAKKTHNHLESILPTMDLASSSNSQNVAFVSSDDTSSTNEAVNTAHDVPAARSKGQASSSTYADDVMAPRNKGNRNRDGPRKIIPVETPANALVVQDGIRGYDWSYQAEEGPTDFTLMAHLSSVPPPYTGNYMPSRHDLSFAGLDDSLYKTNVNETISSVPRIESTASKSNENTRKSVIEQHTYRQAENLRKSQSPRVDKRNWNGIMTQKLGDGFEFNKKACFVCGSLNHLIKDYNFYENKMVGKSVLNNMGMVTAVVTKSRLVPVNAAKQSSQRAAASISTARHVNTATLKQKVNAASPTKYFYFKAHSPLRRHFNQKSAAKTNNFNKKVYTAKVNNVTTAGPEVVVSTAEGKRENAGNPQYALQDQEIFDSICSRNMTGNKSYLTDYQDIDGGFVAFARSPKGGKITEKGKIGTGKLDFEDVYFVKELKFNLFSISQMCDKKNSVLFTETECLVLSPDFKLLDKSQVLLKVPRQNNMYSFDLKNVVPSGGKATQSLLFQWMKGIKREFSVARTPQQNGVAERKNWTLIEAARTMLADSLLPTTFWAETVNTACYVQNRVLVTKPHNKHLITITLADEGFFVGYSINSKAFRVFNTRTRKLEENLHINLLENKPNVAGSGPDWLFDIDLLTNSMNYEPLLHGIKLIRMQSSKDAVADDVGKKTNEEPANEGERNGYTNSTNRDSTVSPSVSTAGQNFTNANDLPTNPLIPDLEDTGIFSGAYDDGDVGAEADLNNLETTMNVSLIPTTRIHKDHPKYQIIGDINSATQTRRMTKISEEHAMVWICQILQEISQKRTRERMSDQEAKEIKAKAREIMPQPSTVNYS